MFTNRRNILKSMLVAPLALPTFLTKNKSINKPIDKPIKKKSDLLIDYKCEAGIHHKTKELQYLNLYLQFINLCAPNSVMNEVYRIQPPDITSQQVTNFESIHYLYYEIKKALDEVATPNDFKNHILSPKYINLCGYKFTMLHHVQHSIHQFQACARADFKELSQKT